MPTRLVNLHDKAFRGALPFTWFFLEHVRYPRSSHQFSERDRKRGRSDRGEEVRKFLRDVVSGDRSAIEQLHSVVHDVSDADLPELTILPKSTITITATVGASLPPDTRRAFQG